MENKEIFLVDNVKCNGCANTIKNNLSRLEQVYEVQVDVDANKVEVILVPGIEKRQEIIEVLAKSGYPEQGTSSMKHVVKSYVSCTVGRVNGE